MTSKDESRSSFSSADIVGERVGWRIGEDDRKEEEEERGSMFFFTRE